MSMMWRLVVDLACEVASDIWARVIHGSGAPSGSLAATTAHPAPLGPCTSN